MLTHLPSNLKKSAKVKTYVAKFLTRFENGLAPDSLIFDVNYCIDIYSYSY